mgnify:CR=1 FL=1
MNAAALLLIVFGLLALRQNVILTVAMATAFVHVAIAEKSAVEFLIQDMWFAIDREVLLSVPMFLLAGAVMTRGAIAARLIDVMTVLTRPVPGGLGLSCVLSCATFAAISGSSVVTMLAVGTIMYPALVKAGYAKSLALGAIASAGTLGIIIPPSIPLLLYGITTETSIGALFLAGFGPGALLAGLIAGWVLLHQRGAGVGRWDAREIARALRRGVWAMMMPIILLGGIYSGFFTPTESAVVALVYALIVESFIHREMKPRDYAEVSLATVKMLGAILPLLAIASSLNTILDFEGVPKVMVAMLTETFGTGWTLMLGINVLLLVVGCLMDTFSAVLLFSPLLLPLAQAAGYDPVHFGIIMIVNLEIGYLTPPVGLNIIIATIAFKVSFGDMVKAVLPFIGLMVLGLAIIVAVPQLSMWLVR